MFEEGGERGARRSRRRVVSICNILVVGWERLERGLWLKSPSRMSGGGERECNWLKSVFLCVGVFGACMRWRLYEVWLKVKEKWEMSGEMFDGRMLVLVMCVVL